MLRQWLFGKKIRLWLGAALLSGVCAASLVYYLLTSFPTNWSNNPYLLGDKSITARIGPYAPYAFMDKAGTVDGYVTDMANAISRMMSVRIQLV